MTGMSMATRAAWRATIRDMASQTAPNPFDKAATQPSIRELINDMTTRRAVPPSSLNTFHDNPRRGDVATIAASLKAHDQYRPITVNIGTHTGRPHEVLAGNHTLLAIRDLAEKHPDDPRWEAVLVHWVDVDDDMCDRIVAVDNRTAQLGGFDMTELDALLTRIGEVNLADIGYNDDDLADIRAQIEENALDLPPRPEGLHDISANPNTSDPARHDSYETTTTRAMILTMPIPQFVWVQECLAFLREREGHDNNVDMILELVSVAVNSDIPDADAEVSADALDQADNMAANATVDPDAQ